MKLRIFSFIATLFLISSISVYGDNKTTHSIHWTGIENRSAGLTTAKFITFESASYPSDNKLPYFSKNIECSTSGLCHLSVINPQYIAASTEEQALVPFGLIDSTLNIQTTELSVNGKKQIKLTILPFIKHNGQILKLASFETSITNQPTSQKIAESKQTAAFASNSILASGRFVKIRVVESGIYKLTYEELSGMGIDPANVRVFGYGGAVLDQNLANPKKDDLPELAIWMEKGSDGVFNAGDYILFYAQGVVKWAYNKSTEMYRHTQNTYSKYGYYFVSSDAGEGKRITERPSDNNLSSNIYSVTEFTDYQVHEIDSEHLIESGKEFYGEVFGEKTSYSFDFNFPNQVTSATTKARLDVVNSSFDNASFNLSLNGGQTKVISVPGRTKDIYDLGRSGSDTFTFQPNGDKSTFSVQFIKPTSSSQGYLNFLEINTRRLLRMTGYSMPFQNLDKLGTSLTNQFTLSNASSSTQIWDITEQDNISKIVTENSADQLTFKASAETERRFIAIDPTAKAAFPSPVIEGAIANQNLHSILQADLVIITHPLFLEQANRLANAHRTKDNITVEVVTTEQIYNEFSSGSPDATAYRWFMRMLYDRATTADQKPKNLLLFGRGSYDNKRLFSANAQNFILTYQADNSLVTTSSYVTDDYFGLLADNQGIYLSSDSMMIGVGRLPVASTDQAKAVVNKIIGYMENKNLGKWKNQLCFLADDGDGNLHMSQANGIAESVAQNNPAFQINKIYLDSYPQEISASGETYPMAKTKFNNLLRSGMFYLNYTGHAGPTGWTNEAMLSLSDIQKLSNAQLPFVMAATCDFLEFDKQEVSGGEQMVISEVGGCIGILSATRPVYASPNEGLNKQIAKYFFEKRNGKHLTLGEIVSAGKNGAGSEFNKLSFMLMGDPALRLSYPTKYSVVTREINNKTDIGNDTLRALSVTTIKGQIEDEDGNKMANFNGSLYTVVYDKTQTIVTLNNDKTSSSPFVYNDRPNALFAGSTKVENGEFSISFMLPKDIKYNYGNGRINYYAADENNQFEAQGYYEDIIIGGTSKGFENEEDGPTASVSLNTENFTDGGKVNESPLFIANISDKNGINTVGSGIGHDIMLTIDQDPSQSYILNDFFESIDNDYTTGSVRYKLPELTEGKHTFTFRVWDLLNNSTTRTMKFEVVKGLTPTIFNVVNYPNPVRVDGKTSIIVEHDRPETILNATVEIFDIAGRKIWSFNQASADNIDWDLKALDGRKVKTGVYLYRVSIKTTNSDSYSKTNKMLVTEQ